ncbi:two-component system LytT family response regulator [Chryseobacterium sp. PvR013]|uniref:LytR/AlgR family response regulator transcription factor n=1 Tax=Chryseobacterium sp. PvR013 TaxID=2806595 RepID=UPI001AEB5990|nr:LytTR family DNA-binding domain-containing protein [Chryseobacterium sp. PvR013]MBP1164625.1 two-component system LytT family response regulator [Chryseobacterium sp. PvR013]
MITAVIVDDEPINVCNLQYLLTCHCPSVNIEGTAGCVDEAYSVIKAVRPDVVFLDIEMPKKNGFELLKYFKHLQFDVIFVTAYDFYGIQAIKFSALDYLLKPINIDELKATVEKIEFSLAKKLENIRLRHLMELLEDKLPLENKKIALPTQKETLLVPVQNILRCESSNNYTIFYLINGLVHVISKPIYEYEEMFRSFGFIRCHQSHLVNKRHVISILNQDSGYLILAFTDQKIPISRQRKILVKEALKS